VSVGYTARPYNSILLLNSVVGGSSNKCQVYAVSRHLERDSLHRFLALNNWEDCERKTDQLPLGRQWRAEQLLWPVLEIKARLHGASYWLASLTVAGFPTGRQLLDRQLDWPLLFTRRQLLDRQ
jgi:hypothetical protein